jgi:hypothetical protein
MLAATLACLALTLLGPAPTDAPTAEDRAAYEEARSKAGRDADAQVRLALWCEQHGMPAERLKHLTLAVLADPAHAAARGLLGLVQDSQGHWVRPEALAEKIRRDATLAAALAEYNQKRARLGRDAGSDDHWKLALWCEENGLEAESRAHLAAVIRLDPSRDAAWRRLGYKKADGRWTTDAQLAAEKAERDAQERADKHWRPWLLEGKAALARREARDRAEALLATLRDPRAVPSVWSVFVAGKSPDPARAVQLLGQIDAAASSRALAALAAFAPDESTRRAAAETLRGRDPREFAPLLIGLLSREVRYEVRPVGGPGSPGALFVEGQQFNVQRLYSPPAMPAIPLYAGEPVGLDANGLPVVFRWLGTSTWQDARVAVSYQPYSFAALRSGGIPTQGDPVLNPITHNLDGYIDGLKLGPNNTFYHKYNRPLWERLSGVTVEHDLLETGYTVHQLAVPIGRMALDREMAARSAEGQLERDVAAIDAYNASLKRDNARVAAILRDIAGHDLGEDPERWTTWYIDQLGYSYTPPPEAPRPTMLVEVPLDYQPSNVGPYRADVTVNKVVGQQTSAHPYYSIPSCFAAGTLVRTRDGLRPIEDIRVGDLVLTQDTATGALSVQPVLVTHHNPPAKTLAVTLGGESVVASTFHRFWVAGRGWRMARDLAPGDVIRTLDGLVPVESVEDGPTQLVYNLDVAVGRSFFVGERGTLVHDNSVPDLRATPFDRAEELAAAE